MEHYNLFIDYEGFGISRFSAAKKFPSRQGEFESALRMIGWLGRDIQADGRIRYRGDATESVVTLF
jgi:hypothetical protein